MPVSLNQATLTFSRQIVYNTSRIHNETKKCRTISAQIAPVLPTEHRNSLI